MLSEKDSISCSHTSNKSTYLHLTELNLSNLQLMTIDLFPFEQFPNLRSLDLSHNQLTLINPNWFRSFENSIEYLNLSHNKLETLIFLKNFQYLKTLNITNNLLKQNERFLSLFICSTLEHLIDSDQEQIHHDRMKLDRLLLLVHQRNTDHRQILIEMIEKEDIFTDFHLSPLGNYFLDQKLSSQFERNLTDDFTRLINIHEKPKTQFEPIQFIRSHHQSKIDLINTPVHMCAFEPNNTSANILATCGGQKVCLINCDTGEVTHYFEVPIFSPALIAPNRKIEKSNKDCFSCLCWIEIEDLKIVAVGATNGHIYLLSPRLKLMFGHIELLASSISCLAWHPSSPMTLVVGSYHTVRFLNIETYIKRLKTFIRKQNQTSTLFDYIDSSAFIHKISSTHIYNLYSGSGPLIFVTDLLFYPLLNDQTILLIGTTLGLFVIAHQDQSPIQIVFPKSIWSVSECVESLRLINYRSSRLIAMNILYLDQIYCFDLEESLKQQQLQIIFTLSNPYRHIPTKLAVFSKNKTADSFECIIGSNHGSFYHHQIDFSSQKRSEIVWPQIESSSSPYILSASLNEHYLCLTTTNNLVCIYKRQ